MAEGAKARPEGAWDKRERARRGREKTCRESLGLESVCLDAERKKKEGEARSREDVPRGESA